VRWSYKLGTFAGIPVYVHATFVLIVGWVVLQHALAGESVRATLVGVAFVLALFACVVLHEFGHALTAKRYGIVTRDITLLPIGGLARLERMPDDPGQELRVALAGPAVNVVIAAILWGGLSAAGSTVPLSQLGVVEGPFLQRLMVANVILALFNMLPAFPMDGGRILRALLAMRLPYLRATQVAAALGQGVALLLGFLGLLGNPFLVFIALFVWIGATQEAGMVEVRTTLGGVPVRWAMLTDFRVLSPGDPLQRAVEMILAGSQQDFPVLEGDRVVGLLLRGDLISALSKQGADAPVASAMRRDFQTATSTEGLDAALSRLQAAGGRPLPVVDGDRLVGLVTHENVGEFLAIQASVRKTA
jgi:Zn-dependent protease/CBS domain-containing protein